MYRENSFPRKCREQVGTDDTHKIISCKHYANYRLLRTILQCYLNTDSLSPWFIWNYISVVFKLTLAIEGWGITWQVALWLLPMDITHDDVIKWKHFPRNWPFVRGIHRSPVNSPHKGQWRGALMFSLICVWINVWVNNRAAGDLRRYRAHYDVIVMWW